jgi:hypothetical protein
MSEFVASKASSHRDVNISYIVGRMNPPHDGHIYLISEMIRQSKETGARPLILLGNGPKNERTMEDPLPFELKRNIIIRKLAELKISHEEYTIIEKSSSPVADIIRFAGDIRQIENIKITYFVGKKPAKNAGDKGDDEKMDWLNAYLIKHYSEISYEINKVIIPAIETGHTLMSGTIVRKSVYESYLSANVRPRIGHDTWKVNHPAICEFYGDEFESQVYNGILSPINHLPREDQVTKIHEYLAPKETRKRSPQTSSKSRKSSKKGGKRKRSKSYKKSYRHILYDKS